MTIPKKILAKWSALRSPEDTARLAESIESGYPEIFARAFRVGKCSDQVFEVMAKFYNDKEENIKQLLKSCKSA